MKVSEETLNAYQRSSDKELNIYFPELDIRVPMDKIYSQSMLLNEMLISGKNVEFVGCISSRFEIQISGLSVDVKGKKIEVSISADETEEIPLFNGIVDSAKRQTNKNYKKITAFDELYTKGELDIAAWYNSWSFPTTIKAFRNGLFEFIGLEQVSVDLPNDNVVFNKEYAPTQLKAISVIKAICQINGAFGIINRYGKFEYRILSGSLTKTGSFPGLELFPGSATFPGYIYGDGEQKIEVKDVPFYKKVDYEDYSVKPVEKVTVRQTDSEIGAVYGDGTNNYIVQGNFFTLNKSGDELLSIAQNIHGAIAGIEFIPFSADNSGYPFIEVGLDAVEYYAYNFEASARARSRDIYTKKTFYVFNRTLKGIQALQDTYGVQGEEYQKEFVTDVSTQIEQIKRNISVEVNAQIEQNLPRYTYTRAEIDRLLSNMYKVESVDAPPPAELADSNTIYLIKGEVVVE